MSLKAVYDDDLANLLKNLNIYDDLVAGKIKCKFCREVTDLENLSSVFPNGGTVHVCCSKAECQEELATLFG